MTVTITNRKYRPLIEGDCIRCPRCKRKQNVLEYVPLMLIEEFENQTATIYKCPKCKWLFAPSVDLKDVLNGVYG